MDDSQPDDFKDTHSRDELPTGKCQLTTGETRETVEAVACADGRMAFRGARVGQIIWTREPVDLGVVR